MSEHSNWEEVRQRLFSNIFVFYSKKLNQLVRKSKIETKGIQNITEVGFLSGFLKKSMEIMTVL